MKLGEVLADKRSERGLTIEQVASATRIREENLRALESDEAERLPAAVYAKGYLRPYARYLGLDPEPLVQELRSALAGLFHRGGHQDHERQGRRDHDHHRRSLDRRARIWGRNSGIHVANFFIGA